MSLLGMCVFLRANDRERKSEAKYRQSEKGSGIISKQKAAVT